MSEIDRVLALHELDQMLGSARDPERAPRWRALGYQVHESAWLERERERLATTVDRRWMGVYERSLVRYGRGLYGVRERVCQGCHITLPTSAAPAAGAEQLHLCESCGRLLYWS